MQNFQKNYQGKMGQYRVPRELTQITLCRMRTEGKPKTGRVRWAAVTAVALVAVLSCSTVVASQILNGKVSQAPSYQAHLPEGQQNVNQIKESDNLKITIKGVEGDATNGYLSFDVETTDGSLLQENSEYRKSVAARNTFQLARLSCDGQSYEVKCFRTDDGSNPAKLSFEGMFDPRGQNLSGKEATLILKDLKDEVTTCEDAGFLFESLYELSRQTGLAAADDFVRTGAYTTYGDGVEAPSYMIRPGNKKIVFSDQFPNSYIDNMGIYAGGEMLIGDRERQAEWLYISITPGNNEEAAALEKLSFQNLDDYRIMGRSTVQGNNLPDKKANSQNYQDKIAMQDGRILLALCVDDEKEGVKEARDVTEDDLKRYRLVKNICAEDVIRKKGSWSFDFRLDYETERKSVVLNQKVSVLDGEITLKNLILSEFTVELTGSYEVPFINKAPYSPVLIYKDGTEFSAGNKDGGEAGPDGFDLSWPLPKKLDVNQVAAIRIFYTEIPID